MHSQSIELHRQDGGSLSPPLLQTKGRALSEPAFHAPRIVLGLAEPFPGTQGGAPAGQGRLAATRPSGAGASAAVHRSLPARLLQCMEPDDLGAPCMTPLPVCLEAGMHLQRPLRLSPQVTAISLGGGARMAIIRDDLTHPLLGGNKFRKLDGLWTSVVGQVGAFPAAAWRCCRSRAPLSGHHPGRSPEAHCCQTQPLLARAGPCSNAPWGHTPAAAGSGRGDVRRPAERAHRGGGCSLRRAREARAPAGARRAA